MSEEEAHRAVRELVSTPDLQSLETFVRCLETWAAVSNLVSAADRRRLWARHVLDSLQLVPLARSAGPVWVDLGSGAGFPGMVVAIARQDTAMTLVEANRKKAAFLVQAIAATGAHARVAPQRAENLPARAVDVVSARALAPLPALLGLAAPFFGPATLGLFHKGADHQRELDEASKAFSFDVVRHRSRTDHDATILAITGLRRS